MKNISRRISVTVFAVLCMTLFAGCQTIPMKTAPPDSTGDTTPTVSIEETVSAVSTAMETEVIESETSATANSKLEELAIVYDGNRLQISGDANEVILVDLFGAPEEKKTHTYTAEDNMDPHLGKTTIEYRFPGLVIKTINTLEEKDHFYVYQMEVTDPKYTTPRLIKVGDSLDKLQEVYPEANLVPDSDGYYLYRPIDQFDTMAFTVKDNSISEIRIYSLLE